MFSAVPIREELNKDDFKYTAVCLPLVGTALGFVMFAILSLCNYFGVNSLIEALIITILPILFTGGIHLDGFMDCHDAFASHAGKERMLEIMKDSSIGAFACLYMVIYELSFFVLAFTLPKETESFLLLTALFSLSRALSAYALLKLPNARSFGMGKSLKDMADDNRSKKILLLESAMILALGSAVDLKLMIFMLAFAVVSYIFCTKKMEKLFGGITGDLAGWLLSSMELSMLLGLNIASGGIF